MGRKVRIYNHDNLYNHYNNDKHTTIDYCIVVMIVLLYVIFCKEGVTDGRFHNPKMSWSGIGQAQSG